MCPGLSRNSLAALLLATLSSALLSACATAPAHKTQATFIKSLRRINRDGSTTTVASKDYTPFQHLIGTRAMVASKAPLDELFAFEADVPNGQGDEGAYIAILHTGGSAELRYFEQSEHRPRTDRYFHRPLTSAEWAQFSAFLQKNPLSALHASPASVTTAPADGLPSEPGSNEASGVDAQPPGAAVVFRITDARKNGALTLEFPAPVASDHPRTDLVKLLADLRDAGERTDPGEQPGGAPPQGMMCTYVQSLPPTATLIYADPFRSVERVWASGGDVRAVISPREPAAGGSGARVDQWLALRNNQWVKSPEPPESDPPATAPALPAAPASPTATAPVRPAAVPAGTSAVVPPDLSAHDPSDAAPNPSAAGPATQPSPFSNPDMLSQEESWSAQPQGTFTAVSHYVPMNELQSQAVEFWVPTLQFDDQHMWVDAPRGLMYVIHEGALFSLPIPSAALMQH